MNIKRGRKALQLDVIKIKELLELGVPKTTIAKSLGVSRASVYRAIERNIDEKS